MKRETFFLSMRNGDWNKTTGYAFTIPKLPDIVWFVHGEPGWWSVSEKSTGLGTGKRGIKTRKEAIAHAIECMEATPLDISMDGIRDSVKVPQALWDSL